MCCESRAPVKGSITYKYYRTDVLGTARQLRLLVHMALGRVDRNLDRFERELGIDPPVLSNFSMGGGGAGMNDSRS